jgi:hypothetical protein
VSSEGNSRLTFSTAALLEEATKEQADDDVTTNVVPFYLPGTDDMEPRPL